MKRRTLVLVLAVAAIVVVAVVSLYVLTPPPPTPLTVADGSMSGAVPWNMTTGSNQTALILNFTATTYANQTEGASSTLTLRLYTHTYYDTTGATLSLNVNATVTGNFASNLRPGALRLTANLTGANSSIQSWGGLQFGTNVSFPMQAFGFYSGTGTLSASVSGNHFWYSDYVEINGRPGHNRWVGFRATIEGPFTPSVTVGILLSVIYAA